LQINPSTSRGLSPSILHEAVEAAIEQIASQTVARIVVEVTDDKSLPKAERKRCKVESPGHKSREAKLVKLADKTSKLRAISFSLRRIDRSNVDRVRRGAGSRCIAGARMECDDASKNAEESVHHQ